MRIVVRLFVVITLLHISCTVYRPRIAGTFERDNHYVNQAAGFKLELPAGWNIGATPNAVSPSLRKLFRSMQSRSSELLFIGMNTTKRCGIRCIVEASALTLEEYFKEVFNSNEHNFDVIVGDYYSDDTRELIDFSYYAEVENTKFRYREYFFTTGKLKIRLSFWTLAGLFNDYLPLMDDILKTVYTSEQHEDGPISWHEKSLRAVIDESVNRYRIAYASDESEIEALSDGSDTLCNGSEHSFLWKVSGGKADCWLFGSIHVLKPEMYPLKPVIEAAFDSSTSLVLELDSKKPENARKLAQFVKEGVFNGDSTIRQVLSTQLYDSMLLYLEHKGVSPEGFKKLRPWMASIMLQQLQVASLGLSAEFGVEQYFMNKLGTRELLELESVEEQMELLQSIGGADFLGYTLHDIENTEKNLRQLIAAWSCGNVTAMERFLFEEAEVAPVAMMEKLLFSRNKRMAERIGEMIGQEKKCFIVVGAAHLVGERSVVEYLENAGYTVKQY